jgi:hypothetical protein
MRLPGHWKGARNRPPDDRPAGVHSKTKEEFTPGSEL